VLARPAVGGQIGIILWTTSSPGQRWCLTGQSAVRSYRRGTCAPYIQGTATWAMQRYQTDRVAWGLNRARRVQSDIATTSI